MPKRGYLMVLAGYLDSTGNNAIIGVNNNLPWQNLPGELKLFRKLTMCQDSEYGSPVSSLKPVLVMGINTWKSIGSKPLPGRDVILIGNPRPGFKAPEGIRMVSSAQMALDYVPDTHVPFLVGGGKVYNQALSDGVVDEVFFTHVINRTSLSLDSPGVVSVNISRLSVQFENVFTKIIVHEGEPVYYINRFKRKS